MPDPSSGHVHEISTHLYIGDRHAALDLDTLRKYGITHIVNCAKELRNYHESRPECEFTYLRVPLEDTPFERLPPVLPQALDFIESALTEGSSVLVHCNGGSSRSGSVVVAWWMRKHLCDWSEAIAACKALRSVVHPGSGFVLALRAFQSTLHGAPPVSPLTPDTVNTMAQDFADVCCCERMARGDVNPFADYDKLREWFRSRILAGVTETERP
ncbi:atypical dual specificity phosphatase, subfamily A [Kipferlia bialata]|uniref:protein-serine/threonine phosphatase n=1 Tax=Kipferlia bialata TaxID=797122 RepID=A0A391NTZ7_9EUKA|nr:atypical dual specificity phosphatase, subfamily A [Kipferlia bialata]|eukprot:g5257.t1